MHLVYTNDIIGFLEKELHIVNIDAYIFSGDVTAMKTVYKTSESQEQSL